MKNLITLLAIALLALHCGGNATVGGTEAGNPPQGLRIVEGNVATNNNALLRAGISPCFATQVIALDSTGSTTNADVGSDCTFEISLAAGKAYAINLLSGDTFVASLLFQNSPSALPSAVFSISSGSTRINLGRIRLSNSDAFPETEPSEFNDDDNDGTNDFDDEDDDGDGVSDEDEDDCDLDGYRDDFDDDNDSCEDSEDSGDGEFSGNILEVRPAHSSTNVDTDEEIQARFDCVIDETSLTAATFSIVDASNNPVSCTFELEDEDQRVVCQPEDLFDVSTTYTATINGMECLDGTSIETISWSWTTRATD